MWNPQHKQYNIDRLELVDVLYEQLNGEVDKDLITHTICDYEALIAEKLCNINVAETQWIIPSVVYLYNYSARQTRVGAKKKGHRADVLKQRIKHAGYMDYMQQKLIDFFEV